VPESVPAPKRLSFSSGIDVLPARDLRLWFPDRLELLHRQTLRPRVVFVDNDRDAVVGDLELEEGDAVFLAELPLVVLDLPRRVREVGLIAAEALEPTARSGHPDRDADLRLLLAEPFRGEADQWRDGAGAVDLDAPGQLHFLEAAERVLLGRLGGRRSAGPVAAAGRQQEQQQAG
jgi:hypothetical protein